MGELYTRDAILAIVHAPEYNEAMAERERYPWEEPEMWAIEPEGMSTIWGMREDYIRKLCRLGKLGAWKDAGRWFIPLDRAMRWARAAEKRGRRPARAGRPDGRGVRFSRIPDVMRRGAEDVARLPGME